MPAARKKTQKKIRPRKKAVARIRKAPGRAAILRLLRKAAARPLRAKAHQLERHEGNPILEPREDRFWEMKATFNPGAVYADNRVHLLYRAIGGDDVSVLGYAASKEGTEFMDRPAEPAFIPTSYKTLDAPGPAALPAALPSYCSGGGWNGGCEDPRITVLSDRVYLMYTAFDGWGSIRIALTSIGLGNFLNKNWDWEKPTLISPPGEIHKNWVLFPEKINGKFAILHSMSPDILIDYFDSLEELKPEEAVIRSRYDRVANATGWDTWIRGAGPPPIKTRLGWLLFYHAMDRRDPNRYKLGAMLLDLQDPTRVLYRSQVPVLEPDAYYENNGFKAGVVYSCGAVVKDGELYVYYGGSDSVTCVAMANLDKFLEDLKRYGAPKLSSVSVSKRPPRHARH